MENFTKRLLVFFDRLDSIDFSVQVNRKDNLSIEDKNIYILISHLRKNKPFKDEFPALLKDLKHDSSVGDTDALLKVYNELNRMYSSFDTPQKLDVAEPNHLHLIRENKLKIIQDLIKTIEEYLPIENNPEPQSKSRVSDKYYALLYLILVSLGKENQIINYSKKGIIDFGKNKYNTGQGFYVQIRNIDLLDMKKFVRSLPNKDKLAWKKIITEISGNDADVISWLSKLPN